MFYVQHDGDHYLQLFERFNVIREEYSYFEGEMGAIFVSESDALKYQDFVARIVKYVELANSFSEEERDHLLDFIY